MKTIKMTNKEMIIKQIEDYIMLYKGDQGFLKSKQEISINNRTILELNHIKDLIKGLL